MGLRQTAEELQNYLLDYTNSDIQLTPAELAELELEMHEGPEPRDPAKPLGLHGWSLNHEARFEDFTALELNTRRYPWQRINVNTVPVSPLTYLVPRKIMVPLMRRSFIKSIGVRANNAFEAYDKAPADSEISVESGGLSTAQKIGEIIAAHEAIVVAVSHSDNLDDLAVNHGPVAIAAASKRSRLIGKVGTGLSKTLARENYKGKPVLDLFKYFGKLYLTFPDTDNTAKWQIPDKAKDIVITSGARAMYRDIDNGAAIVMAPAGTAMAQNPEPIDGRPAYGPKTLHLPEFSENSSRMIAKFGYYAVSASWQDQVSVGSVHELPDWSKLATEKGKIISKKERAEIMKQHIANIRMELAQRIANIAEMPVTLEVEAPDSSEVIKKTVLPQVADAV